MPHSCGQQAQGHRAYRMAGVGPHSWPALLQACLHPGQVTRLLCYNCSSAGCWTSGPRSTKSRLSSRHPSARTCRTTSAQSQWNLTVRLARGLCVNANAVSVRSAVWQWPAVTYAAIGCCVALPPAGVCTTTCWSSFSLPRLEAHRRWLCAGNVAAPRRLHPAAALAGHGAAAGEAMGRALVAAQSICWL